MKKQFGHYVKHLFRHAELVCSATPHPCAFAWDCPVGTSSCGPASLKGPESSSGRRTCFGRSMIEMLGVLAIVGVLSIGGIMMYRRAVNNHHANTILDDANRLAFVIMESNRAFSTNAFIDNIEYSKTSTYNLDAFLGASSGQFGIVVTDVPKGVCEPLIDKANIDYKVRVLPANTAESVEQLSASGLIYDSFNKDICTNDLNDIVLYFGDTSAQCNKPKEGEDYAPCNTNAECCGGSFCWYSNEDPCFAGTGKCKLVSTYGYANGNGDIVTSDGKTWTRSEGALNWWSAQSWCEAQGKQLATREQIGCKDLDIGKYCTDSGTSNRWAKTGSTLLDLENSGLSAGLYWLLERYSTSCNSYLVNSSISQIGVTSRDTISYRYALCH